MAASVIGTGMVAFGRHPETNLRGLSGQAMQLALADAGLSMDQVQMIVFGNAVEGVLRGQEMIRGEVMARHSGHRGIPILNVENACASSSSALQVACMAIDSGTVEVALVLGAEQLTHSDKARSFGAVATAVDLDEEAELQTFVQDTLLGGASGQTDLFRSPLMPLYADKVAKYVEKWGVSDSDLAKISVKNRFHGSLNPLAQFQSTVDEEQVLSSRMIAEPLRLLMCAPIGDGAAAAIVASADYAARLGGEHLTVRACSLRSNGAHPDAARPVTRAAMAAYESAGLGPEDIDLAEMHDACSPAEFWLYEELGFCAPGEAAKLVADEATTLGGAIPVNTSGGLIARGHPLGATGCAQLVELADQLRGRGGSRQVAGARVGLAQNGGGIMDDGDEGVAVVTILSLPN